MRTETLPHDSEAEAICLGAMLIDGAALAKVREILRVGDFLRPAHQRLAQAALDLADRGAPIELAAVHQHLRDTGQLERVGGAGYLVQLVEGVPSTASVDYYAKIVRGRARLRRIIGLSDKVRAKCYAPGAEPGTILAELETAIRAEDDGQGESARPTFLKAADLIRDFPNQREPVIEGIARRGEQFNLVSGPKINKSWMLLHLALCVVTGRPWLGFPTRRGSALVLDYELHPATIAKRLQAVMEAMGLHVADIGDALRIVPLRGKRLAIDGLLCLLADIGPGRFDLVIVDPLYRIFPPELDENSNADLAALFARLQAEGERLDAAIATVHHLTKGDQSSKALTDLGAGGGSQSRAADGHLAIRPHAEDGAAVFGGVVRSFPPFEAFCIRWCFPLWELAPELDPADLKKSQGRRAGGKAETQAESPKPSLDARRFVATFVTATPRTRDTILAQANAAGLNDHRAVKLLASAEGQGLAFRWRVVRDKRAYFANRPQPVLTSSEDTHKTRTPPDPPTSREACGAMGPPGCE